MLDPYVRPLVDPVLDRAGRALAARGASADGVTLAGLALGLAAAVLIALEHSWMALVPLMLGRIADGLDGAVARHAGGTPFGAYWDIVADFVFYAAVPLAFVLADPSANGAAGAVLLAAFYVNGASFLGFAILAERHGMEDGGRRRKGFHHSGGLLEGTETIAFFVLICLLPQAFVPLALVFGGLCLLTAAARIWRARSLFRGG